MYTFGFVFLLQKNTSDLVSSKILTTNWHMYAVRQILSQRRLNLLQTVSLKHTWNKSSYRWTTVDHLAASLESLCFEINLPQITEPFITFKDIFSFPKTHSRGNNPIHHLSEEIWEAPHTKSLKAPLNGLIIFYLGFG